MINLKPTTRIWVRGGLGNQLHSMAAGIVVASARGTDLVLDGAIPARAQGDGSRRYWLNDLDLFCQGVQLEHSNNTWQEASLSSLASRGFRRALESGASLVPGVFSHRYIDYRNYLDNEPDHLLDTDLTRFAWLDGHFETASIPFAAARVGLRRTTASKTRPSLTDDVERGDVAVHVRLGDFRTHKGGSLMLSSAYYANAIQALVANGNELGRFRVFSDEPDVALALVESVAPGGTDVIGAADATAPEHLALMSAHPAIIASRSSFAWWAGFMAPESTVIGPEDEARFQQCGQELGWVLASARSN